MVSSLTFTIKKLYNTMSTCNIICNLSVIPRIVLSDEENHCQLEKVLHHCRAVKKVRLGLNRSLVLLLQSFCRLRVSSYAEIIKSSVELLFSSFSSCFNFSYWWSYFIYLHPLIVLGNGCFGFWSLASLNACLLIHCSELFCSVF